MKRNGSLRVSKKQKNTMIIVILQTYFIFYNRQVTLNYLFCQKMKYTEKIISSYLYSQFKHEVNEITYQCLDF